ncbi:hypothetical protein [Actinokineospora sp.]|uniref:hypothetical protein n=1 Tax=Actinokineospora sp. TaxID=1872133 RepID=UPI0040379BDA
MRFRAALLTGLAAIATVLSAAPAQASDFTTMDTRPGGCSWRFKDPNPRQRTINRDTYMHEMSNPPVCAPHGPILGTLSRGSTFIVYYADSRSPYWCYGYSWQIARTGYILCDAYN